MAIKIILADLSETIYKVVVIGLKKYNVNLMRCQNLEDILNLSQYKSARLVIVDSNLVKDEEEIKKISLFSKIILLKSSLEEREDSLFMNLGFLRVLKKPFNNNELINIIKGVGVNLTRSEDKDLHTGEDLYKSDIEEEFVDNFPTQNSLKSAIVKDIIVAIKTTDSELNEVVISSLTKKLENKVSRLVEEYCEKYLKIILRDTLREEMKNITKEIYS